MKILLKLGAVSFLCAALLDPLWASGIGQPVQWFRDAAMAAAGAVCLYLLVRFWNSL